MDLETENRIAAIILKEAAELQKQAEREGVHVYLKKPTVRGRPNSRFLTATVLGVQQANRTVEVNEMWRVRQKELELDNRLKKRSRHANHEKERVGIDQFPKHSRHNMYYSTSASGSANKRDFGNCSSFEDTGLRDEEVDEFLHLSFTEEDWCGMSYMRTSADDRVKRGRGAVGSRMDETGPYLHSCPGFEENVSTDLDVRENRIVYGPEKPSILESLTSVEEFEEVRRKKLKAQAQISDRKNSKKHRSKENSKDKKQNKKQKKRINIRQ